MPVRDALVGYLDRLLVDWSLVHSGYRLVHLHLNPQRFPLLLVW